MGAFNQATMRSLADAIESGEDYSDAGVRVATIHTRQDVALTAYLLVIANKRSLLVLLTLGWCATLLGLILLVLIFK